MQVPAKSGSLFFNYKKSFSIVLMAISDADYKFTLVDTRNTGRNMVVSFQGCHIGITFEENLLNNAKPETVENTNVKLPYVFVRDEAFPLRENI